MSQDTNETDDKTGQPSAAATGSAAVREGFLSSPWYVLFYLAAFILFTEINWKLGLGWLLWRMGNNARLAWEKRQNAELSEQPPKNL